MSRFPFPSAIICVICGSPLPSSLRALCVLCGELFRLEVLTSMEHPFAHLCGWVDAPERHAVAASLPTLAQAGPGLVAAGGDVLLYKAWADATGGYWPYVAQTIGDCVAHGHGHGYDLLQCVEYVLEGAAPGALPRDATETDTEFLYGIGREAAGMLGS